MIKNGEEINRSKILQAIKDVMKARYTDPTVEVTQINSGTLRVRVVQERRGDVYFRIQVSQEHR